MQAKDPAPQDERGGWTAPVILAGDASTITVIDGLTFVMSDARGDIADGPDGLIADDTRHLSRMRVTIDGAVVHSLGAAQLAPATARFRGYIPPSDGSADPALEIERRRTVTAVGLHDELILHWWAQTPSQVEVCVELGADFVDIFSIRGVAGAAHPHRSAAATTHETGVSFADADTGLATVVHFDRPPSRLSGGVACWTAQLQRADPWRLGVSVRAETGLVADDLLGRGQRPRPTGARVISDPPALGLSCRRALADLDALSMPDRLAPERRLVAAGIPWFVALFGRDSLIASHQARAFVPHQLLDTLLALAARQGQMSDPGNEEEPGKILHEVRLTRRPWLGEGTAAGVRPYYGSVDATPLFLILYGTLWRWGASRTELELLLPAARAALQWMRGPGDPDGDGLLEYRPTGSRSLSNQSWKDSVDAVQFADGHLAEGPIAMVEVQGYAYRARREMVAVLRHLGHDAEGDAVEAEAEVIRAHVREQFWRPAIGHTPGYFALALDGHKRQVDSVASNMGHLLWCDLPSADEARDVARHLTGPAMASGWGLRTLASDMAGFNPISYHVGSVWPHDTAIACEGLRRYGLDVPALELADALIAAMAHFDHRLPELFGGHTREPGDVPTPYPTACRPQAWAAGVPLQLATMCLGLEPDVPNGRLQLNPILSPRLAQLEVSGIAFPTGALSVRVDRAAGVRIIQAPHDLVIELRE